MSTSILSPDEIKALTEQNKKVEEEVVGADNESRIRNFSHREMFITLMETIITEADATGRMLTLIKIKPDMFDYYRVIHGAEQSEQILRGLFVICLRIVDPIHFVLASDEGELSIICEGMDQNEALILAERLRMAVRNCFLRYGSNPVTVNLTVSIGVATFPIDGATTNSLLSAVDNSVYQAWVDGGNRVSAPGLVNRQEPRFSVDVDASLAPVEALDDPLSILLKDISPKGFGCSSSRTIDLKKSYQLALPKEPELTEGIKLTCIPVWQHEPIGSDQGVNYGFSFTNQGKQFTEAVQKVIWKAVSTQDPQHDFDQTICPLI